MLAQAASHVNFPALDTNGDGTLQTNEAVIYFILAGDEAAGTSKTPNIWAHAWSGAREALALWESPSAYPFEWLARWPLVAILMGRDDLPAAMEQAEALLLDHQQTPAAGGGVIAGACRRRVAGGRRRTGERDTCWPRSPPAETVGNMGDRPAQMFRES